MCMYIQSKSSHPPSQPQKYEEVGGGGGWKKTKMQNEPGSLAKSHAYWLVDEIPPQQQIMAKIRRLSTCPSVRPSVFHVSNQICNTKERFEKPQKNWLLYNRYIKL